MISSIGIEWHSRGVVPTPNVASEAPRELLKSKIPCLTFGCSYLVDLGWEQAMNFFFLPFYLENLEI